MEQAGLRKKLRDTVKQQVNSKRLM